LSRYGASGGAGGRGAVVFEGEVDFADADDVAGAKLTFADYFFRVVVEEGAVAAVEVFDEEVVALADDLAVIAADGADFDDDVTVGMATENPFVAFELVPISCLGTVIRQEVVPGAGILLPTAAGLFEGCVLLAVVCLRDRAWRAGIAASRGPDWILRLAGEERQRRGFLMDCQTVIQGWLLTA
jgi:hypothetical protein